MGKLTIESKIPERDFIEGMLNMKHSGVYDNYILTCMAFHAMANRWHIDKMLYYIKLIGISQNK